MSLTRLKLVGALCAWASFNAAHAAELPSGRAAPSDSAHSCAAYGAGFVYVRATDTCVRVSGSVGAEYTWSSSGARASH